MSTQSFGILQERDVDSLKGNALPQRIKELVSGKLNHLTLVRNKGFKYDNHIGGGHKEAVLISKGIYDALEAGAISPAPVAHMIIKTDDFCIPNIYDLLDIINGREQAGHNLQVEQIGSGAKAKTVSFTVPAVAPFTLDLGAPILGAACDVVGAITAVDLVNGIITFDAAQAGVTLAVKFTQLQYTVVGIIRGSKFKPNPVPVASDVVDAVLLSYDHYAALKALNP